MVRIPEWCRGATLKVNGEVMSNPERVRGYARLQRTWKQGDMVELMMPMPVETVKAHPLVEADTGKIALMRGPLVYCLESADRGQAVRRIAVSSRSELKAEYRPDVLNGVTVISGTALLMNAPIWHDSLYAAARNLQYSERTEMTAMPYFANANRGAVDMAVWIAETA
jgi:hypothetical protein